MFGLEKTQLFIRNSKECTYTLESTNACARTRTRTHTNEHTHIHENTRTHTHMNTHIHTHRVRLRDLHFGRRIPSLALVSLSLSLSLYLYLPRNPCHTIHVKRKGFCWFASQPQTSTSLFDCITRKQVSDSWYNKMLG